MMMSRGGLALLLAASIALTVTPARALPAMIGDASRAQTSMSNKRVVLVASRNQRRPQQHVRPAPRRQFVPRPSPQPRQFTSRPPQQFQPRRPIAIARPPHTYRQLPTTRPGPQFPRPALQARPHQPKGPQYTAPIPRYGSTTVPYGNRGSFVRSGNGSPASATPRQIGSPTYRRPGQLPRMYQPGFEPRGKSARPSSQPPAISGTRHPPALYSGQARQQRLDRLEQDYHAAVRSGDAGRAGKIRQLMGAYGRRPTPSGAAPSFNRPPTAADRAANSSPANKKAPSRPDSVSQQAQSPSKDRSATETPTPRSARPATGRDAERSSSSPRQQSSGGNSFAARLESARQDVQGYQRDLDRLKSDHAKDTEDVRKRYLSASKDALRKAQDLQQARRDGDDRKAAKLETQLKKSQAEVAKYQQRYQALKSSDIDQQKAAALQTKLTAAHERVTALERERPLPTSTTLGSQNTGPQPSDLSTGAKQQTGIGSPVDQPRAGQPIGGSPSASPVGLTAGDKRWVDSLPDDLKRQTYAIPPEQVEAMKRNGSWLRYQTAITDDLRTRTNAAETQTFANEYGSALRRNADLGCAVPVAGRGACALSAGMAATEGRTKDAIVSGFDAVSGLGRSTKVGSIPKLLPNIGDAPKYSSPGFASASKLDEHYRFHKSDFSVASPKEYESLARAFLTAPKNPHVLERIRANGDIVRFDPRSGDLGIITTDGTIRTFFKPAPRTASNPRGYDPNAFESPLDYFYAQ